MSAEHDVKSFRDLIVWHRAIELSVATYEFTRSFPAEELYGLRSQLRRASVSIASNIAEGSGRRSSGELCQFLGHALGSNNELRTQLVIAEKLSFGAAEQRFRCERLAEEIERMFNALIRSIEQRRRPVKGEAEG
jgi:four helix bundle protein